MAQTSKQVQTHIMELLKGSALEGAVSGGVYRNGYRPKDSKLEDIIVIHTTGIPDQVQTGVITLNIYVPNTKVSNVEDGERTEELEMLAQSWMESLDSISDSYYFELQETISTVADAEIKQHFVVVKLKYEFLNN